MAFQGFAREEQFSTNQIKIDIDSVINSDLKEAGRMSKFMAANAAMGEKHNTMYLNAMISKHNAEEKNRDRNFKFFMDNRAQIQEQIKYNNRVKAEDASRSHAYVPSFMDMLQPALMKLAVDVGAAGITKMFGDMKVAKEEAAAKEKQNTLDWGKNVALNASNDQQELIKDPDFIQQIRSNVAAESKAAMDLYASKGDHRPGVNFAQNLYRWNKLDVIDRQNAFHSTELTAVAAQKSLMEFTTSINGSPPITYNDVVSGRYPNAADEWLTRWNDEFKEARGIHDVGAGAQFRANKGIHNIQAQVQKAIYNNKYKKDVADQYTADVNYWENTPGTSVDKLKAWLLPVEQGGGGMFARTSDRAASLEWARNHLENYGSPEDIRRIMAHQFPGIPSINSEAPSDDNKAGTVKYQNWRKSLDAAVTRTEEGYENSQKEIDLKFRQIQDSVTNPQDARSILEYIRLGGEGHAEFNKASDQVKRDFQTTIMKKAGYMGAQSTMTQGEKIVTEGTTSADAAAIAESAIAGIDGKPIALDGIPDDDLKALKPSFRDTYRTWGSGVADDLIANGWDPEDTDGILQEINSITRPGSDDPRFERLQWLMQATWEDPKNPGKRLLIPHFPNMRKPAGVGEKSFVSTIETNRLNAKNANREFSLTDDVDWTRPEVQAWLRRMDMGIRYKHIDVQNLLSNTPSWVKALMRTQKYSSAGQIYQAAIDYGDYGDKYKRLSESDYMDYNEVKQQHDTFGNQFAQLGQHSQAVIAARHAANGGFTPSSTVVSLGRGMVSPTPEVDLAANKGGYTADTGLDIHGPEGTPITAMLPGTLVYAERGHSAQMGQSSSSKGHTDQHSVLIKLDNPFTHNGKQINYAWYTHLQDLNPAIANKTGIKVNAGQHLGGMGIANGVSHLHLGLVGDRAQTVYLNHKEVREVLNNNKQKPAINKTSNEGKYWSVQDWLEAGGGNN